MLAFAISDRLWEIIKWPFLVFGFAVALGLLGGIAYGFFVLVRCLWRRLTRREFATFTAWMFVNFALTLGATLAIVHRAVSLPTGGPLSSHYLAVWALEWGAALLLAAVLGGIFVFQRSTPWQTLLSWPWLVGVVVGLAYTMGVSGQMDSGSKLCNAPSGSSCDNAWGLGAWLIGFAAAVVLGGTFVASASLARVAPRRLRLRRL